MNAYANQIYKTRSVAAASPADQVAMLLETAGRHMNTALEALDQRNYELRFQATEKAQTIIVGLQQCLAEENPDAKAMVEVFDAYYSSLQMMIMRVNIRNDSEACRMVIEGLRQMAFTWRQIGQQTPQTGGGQTAAPAPAASPYGSAQTPAAPRSGLDFAFSA
jgi:flagellar biosynthetic protein FliS